MATGDDDVDVDVLQVAIAKQEAVLHSMQSVHGECTPRLYVHSVCYGWSIRSLLFVLHQQLRSLHSLRPYPASVDPAIADDLAQLALLLRMRGSLHEALPLLHRRLVIHDKFGPGASSHACGC